MNGLALCAGIGGLEIGLKLAAGVRTICYVERDAFAASCLVARMEEAALDQAPIWDDLSTFDASAWRGCVDLVSAGFPCQPFSVAGKQRGTADERHLWPHVARIIEESGASLAFLENVPGLVGLGLAEVLGDLAEMGFNAEWGCIKASDVGAPHGRERVFILAYSNRELVERWGNGRELLGKAREVEGNREQREWGRDSSCDRGQNVGDAEGARLALVKREGAARLAGSQRYGGHSWPPGPGDYDGWREWIAAGGPQPVLLRGVDGPAAWLDRADRLRCLGNAVVPQQAAEAFRQLAARALT